ncbi:MAG TPA: efflux RND transporter periplasmic adaptor subunit [Planctomycetota bacterium]|nr:efflux RND transporter periplasmic adaptor subunit [Planctomycetota bacterium]
MKARLSSSARLATAGFLALAAAGCGPEGDARPPAPPPKVSVAFPETREVQDEDEFNGWTAAVQSVDVRSRVRGHIEQVNFEDGEIVEQGALLFSLDARPFEADVEAATARRAAYEAQLVADRREQARLEELLGKGGASQKQVEKKQADVKALEAEIAAITSDIKRLQLDIEFSKITSPIAGRASRALLTAGNLVGAGGSDPVLTTVVCVDPIHVYFDVPERVLLKIRTETQATNPVQLGRALAGRQLPFTFGLDTDEGFPRQGVLDFAENVVDAGTGTLRLRGTVSNPDGFLLAGARVKVRLTLSLPMKVLLVPDVALVADQNLRYVLVVGPDDKVLRKDVRPGRLLDDGLRVLLPAPGGQEEDGVQPTDRVIVEGQARARLFEPAEALDREGNPVPWGAAPAAAPGQ